MPKQDTTNHTKAKQFRLGVQTRDKLAACSRHFDMNETDVVRMLIADCYARITAGMPPKKSRRNSSETT